MLYIIPHNTFLMGSFLLLCPLNTIARNAQKLFVLLTALFDSVNNSGSRDSCGSGTATAKCLQGQLGDCCPRAQGEAF